MMILLLGLCKLSIEVGLFEHKGPLLTVVFGPKSHLFLMGSLQ